MAHNHKLSQSIIEDKPYIKICPYTGYSQFRRKYEGTADTLSYGYTTTYEQYYSWSISKNRLRGVYPTGGRYGMCMVLEKTRTARYSPYSSYAWPDSNMSLPAWPYPTLISSGRVDYQSVTQDALLNSSLNTSLVFTWTMSMGDVQSINDTHPPAGFCTDLSGILAYIRASDIALQTIDLTKIGNVGIESSLENTPSPLIFSKNRYDIAPMVLNPPLDIGVIISATEALFEITPSGIYWPAPDDAPISSDTFDKNKILPFVESWREMNLFPIGYDESNYKITYIGNFPIDYQYAFSTDYDGHSSIYESVPGFGDEIVYEFNGFVYWVTREGPIDIIREEIDPDKEEKVRTVKRRVLTLIFESGLTGIEDNEKSRYRSNPDSLISSNSISPRDIKSDPEGFLVSYGVLMGGLYNQIYEELGMDSPGAPSESDSAWSGYSEILNNYDVSNTVMSGNIIVDDDMFKRCMISGQIQSVMWSEIGRIFRYSAPFSMPSGGSLTLIGTMATVGILGTVATSSFVNERFPIYLGGISQSLLHNNPMPELGVTLGSHVGDHKIYLIESGISVEFGGEEQEAAPKNLNKLLNNVPKQIYNYRGFAASPHKITILSNGMLLIPTDIGILQYDYINEKIECEWLNPVLIPFIADLIQIDENIDIMYNVSDPNWTQIETPDGIKMIPVPNITKSINKNGQPYNATVYDIPKINSDMVYERTGHIGSYGQVCYESADFSCDLKVLIDR